MGAPTQELDPKIQQQKIASQNKPDWLLGIVDKNITNLEDLSHEGYTADDFSLQPASTYWSNPKIQERLKDAGLQSEEDFQKMYDQGLAAYNAFAKEDFAVKALSDKRYIDTPFTKALGLKTTTKMLGPANVVEEKSGLTTKQIAQEWGERDKDSNLQIVDNSAWKILTEANMHRVKMQDGSLYRNKTGGYELEAVDKGEQLDRDDQVVTMFNSGIFKGSFFDANRQSESAFSTAARNVPKVLPYAKTAAFLLTSLEGLAYAMKGLNNLMGKNEEFDKTMNRVINTFKITSYDKTMKELEHPFSLNSIVSNVADIFNQVGGMYSVGMGTAKGMKALAAKLGANEKVASSFGGYMGKALGQLSMGMQAAGGAYEDALKMGLTKEQASYMMFGIVGTQMYTSKLTEKAMGSPLDDMIESKILRKVVKSELIATGGNVPQPGTPAMGKLIKNIVQTFHGQTSFMQTLASTQPQMYRAAIGALNEGLEEVSENATQELAQQSFNWLHKDKTAGQGRYDDFNFRNFVRDAGISFFYGAVGGGVSQTNLGRRMLGMSDEVAKSDLIGYAMTEEGRAEMDKFIDGDEKVNGTVFGNTNLSYAVNQNGDNLTPNNDPGEADPLRRLSQYDVNKQAYKAQWELTKALVDSHSLVGAQGNVDKTLMSMITGEHGIGAVKLANENAKQALTKILDAKLKIEELREKSTADTITDNKASIKLLEDEIAEHQKTVDDIMTGRAAGTIFLDYLYRTTPGINTNIDEGSPAFLSKEEFLKKAQAYQGNVDALKSNPDLNAEKIKQDSDIVLQAKDADNLLTATNVPFLNAEAYTHAKGIYKEAIAQQLEPVKAAMAAFVTQYFDTKIAQSPETTDFFKSQKESTLETISGIQHVSSFGNIQIMESQDEEAEPIMVSELMSSQDTGFAQQYAQLQQNADHIVAYSDAMNNLRVPMDSEFIPFFLDENGRRFENSIEYELSKAPVDRDIEAILAAKNALKKNITMMGALYAIMPQVNNFKKRFSDIVKDDTPEVELSNDEVKSLRGLLATEKDPEKKGQLQQQLALATKRLNNGFLNASRMLGELLQDINTLEAETYDLSRNPVESMDLYNKNLLDQRADVYETIVTELLAPLTLIGGKDAFVAELTNINDGLITKLKQAESFEERYLLMNEIDQRLFDFFKSLDFSQREMLATNINTQLSTGSDFYKTQTALFHLQSIVGVDQKQLQEILLKTTTEKGFTPTFEQEIAIRQAVGFFNLTKIYPAEAVLFDTALKNALPHRMGQNEQSKLMTYPSMLFVKGSWGAGKTTYVAGNVISILSQLAGDSDPKGIITSAPLEEQANKLRDAIDKFGISALSSKGGHISIEQFIAMMENGDTALHNAAMLTLYDEATYIPVDKIMQLQAALDSYNQAFRQGKAPLQVLLLGDPHQFGYYTKNTDGTYTPYNIGEATLVPGLFSTSDIKTSQRSGYEYLEDFLAFIRNVHDNKNAGGVQNPAFDGLYGLNSSKRLAGINVVNSSTAVAAIEEIIEQNKNTQNRIVYITDHPTDPSVLEWKKKANDANIPNFKIVTPEEAQGSECEIVISDLDDTDFIQRDDNERMKLKRIGVTCSRATEYVVYINNSNRPFTSKRTDSVAQKVKLKITPADLETMKTSRVKQMTSAFEKLSGKKFTQTTTQQPTSTPKQQTKIQPRHPDLQDKGLVEQWYEDAKKTNSTLTWESFVAQVDVAMSHVDSGLATLQETLQETPMAITSLFSQESISENGEIVWQSVYDQPVFHELFKVLLDSHPILQSLGIDKLIEIKGTPSPRVLWKHPAGSLSPVQQNLYSRYKAWSTDGSTYIDHTGQKVIDAGIFADGSEIIATPDGFTEGDELHVVNTLIPGTDGASGQVLIMGFSSDVEADRYFETYGKTKADQYLIQQKDLQRQAIADAYSKGLYDVAIANGELTEQQVDEILRSMEDERPEEEPDVVVVPPSPVENAQQDLFEIAQQVQQIGKNNADKDFVLWANKNQLIPGFTWLMHDLGSGMSLDEMHSMKLQALGLGQLDNTLRYTLKVGNINDLEHQGQSDIRLPELLDTYDNGRILYIEVSKGGKKMVLAVMPYFNKQRANDNSFSGALQALQGFKQYLETNQKGLDITSVFQKHIIGTRGTNLATGRVHLSNTEYSLLDLVNKHRAGNPDKLPPIYFSEVFIDTDKQSAKKGSPKIFYSYNPNFSQHVERYKRGDITLDQLLSQQVGILVLNPTFRSLEQTVDILKQLYKLHGDTANMDVLLNSFQASRLAESIKLIRDQMAPDQLDLMNQYLTDVLSTFYTRGKKTMVNHMAFIQKLESKPELFKVLSNALYTSRDEYGGPDFHRGILLQLPLERKSTKNNQLGPAQNLSNEQNSVISDQTRQEERNLLLSLINTNVEYISPPALILSKRFFEDVARMSHTQTQTDPKVHEAFVKAWEDVYTPVKAHSRAPEHILMAMEEKMKHLDAFSKLLPDQKLPKDLATYKESLRSQINTLQSTLVRSNQPTGEDSLNLMPAVDALSQFLLAPEFPMSNDLKNLFINNFSESIEDPKKITQYTSELLRHAKGMLRDGSISLEVANQLNKLCDPFKRIQVC